LPPETTAHLLESAKKQWKRHCKQLARCQEKFSEASVHASRICARRLLSVSELLGAFCRPKVQAQVRKILKHHLDVFDDLRDTQVQRGLLKKFSDRFSAAAEFREHLRNEEKRLVRQTRKAVRKIRTNRLRKLLRSERKAAEEWVKNHSSDEGTRKVLGTVTAAFRKAVGVREAIDPSSSETIHRTRVAFKHFRYMVEALARLAAVNTPLLKDLQHFQTLMGDIQDLEVLGQDFQGLAPDIKIEKRAAIAFLAEVERMKSAAVARFMHRADVIYGFWCDALSQPQPAGKAGRASVRGNGNGAAAAAQPISK